MAGSQGKKLNAMVVKDVSKAFESDRVRLRALKNEVKERSICANIYESALTNGKIYDWTYYDVNVTMTQDLFGEDVQSKVRQTCHKPVSYLGQLYLREFNK